LSRHVVTGCAGFIGGHLVQALLARGDEVVGIDADLRGARGGDGLALVQGDLAVLDLAPVLADADGVFHLAGRPGVRGSWGDAFAAYAHDNLVATQRVFEAAARAGVRVVWASSSSVYGDGDPGGPPRPISPYGVTKLACESLAAAYAGSQGLADVALRLFTVYGPRQRPDMALARVVAALAGDGRFTVYGSGRQTRDLTYVDDAVRAALLAMERGRPGAAYYVGGGASVSLAEALATAERLSGRRLRLTHGEERPGDMRATRADVRAARDELGWEPEVSFEEGLAAHLEWGGVPMAVTGRREAA
jgi:UDP-glucuronate 4-epimerase